MKDVHFSSFTGICQSLAHIFNVSMSICRSALCAFSFLNRSLMYVRKSNGPRTYPCGMSVNTLSLFDFDLHVQKRIYFGKNVPIFQEEVLWLRNSVVCTLIWKRHLIKCFFKVWLENIYWFTFIVGLCLLLQSC